MEECVVRIVAVLVGAVVAAVAMGAWVRYQRVNLVRRNLRIARKIVAGLRKAVE